MPGCDEIPSELIKYTPNIIHEQITEICNTMAETGNTPWEITYGILKSLQRLNKTKGPPSNLRLISFFSSLGKILVACIINGIKDRFNTEIQPSQAAYRPNRLTSKHIFTSELIIERTITARKSVHLIILWVCVQVYQQK